MKLCRPKPMLILVGAIACLALLMAFLVRHEQVGYGLPVVRKLYWRIWVTLPEATHRFLPAPKFFPPFPPDLPPIAGANPSVRHPVSLRVPTRLKVERTSETVSVSIDPGSFAMTNITVGTKMETGIEDELFVYTKGEPRPEASESRVISELKFDLQPFTLLQNELPPRGKKYVVEVEFTAFETDIPAQHGWNPRSGKFKMLWQGTLKQIVE